MSMKPSKGDPILYHFNASGVLLDYDDGRAVLSVERKVTRTLLTFQRFAFGRSARNVVMKALSDGRIWSFSVAQFEKALKMGLVQNWLGDWEGGNNISSYLINLPMYPVKRGTVCLMEWDFEGKLSVDTEYERFGKVCP